MNVIHVTSEQIACSNIGAALLTNDALRMHYEHLVMWMLRTPEVILRDEFCQEVAWFREIGWELQRRDLLEVH
jgi:hypothetical protein